MIMNKRREGRAGERKKMDVEGNHIQMMENRVQDRHIQMVDAQLYASA